MAMLVELDDLCRVPIENCNEFVFGHLCIAPPFANGQQPVCSTGLAGASGAF
jgi:hypothetical protein